MWTIVVFLFAIASMVWIQNVVDLGIITSIAVCFGRWVEMAPVVGPLTIQNFLTFYSLCILSIIVITVYFSFQDVWKLFHFTKLSLITLVSMVIFYLIVMMTFGIWDYKQVTDPLRTQFFWLIYPELRILWALLFVTIIKKPETVINALSVKKYYVLGEFYDWVTQPRRLEKIFHRKREKTTVMLVEKYFKGSVILDIGCGTGLITRHLNSDQVVGLDINRWNLKKAKEHANQIDVILADAENLPIKSTSITNVLCTETLEHVPSPENAVNEAFRVLMPKGKIVCSMPSKNPVWSMRKLLLTSCPVTEPFHHSYNVKMVEELLGQFHVIHVFSGILFTSIFAIATKKG